MKTSRPSRALTKLALLLALNIGLFLMVEGFASLVLTVRHLVEPVELISERRHTKYDEELGWINIPDLAIEDMYGPGKAFHTNSQGFRNSRDFPISVPPGKIRILCNGDSFTMGYGEADEHAWCHQLESLDDRVETVNMGQGGYGIGQSFLWYMRDGVPLDHQVHLFVFVSFDFFRTSQDAFMDYGKPLLKVGPDGHLVTTNVPVPKRFYRLPRLEKHLRRLEELRIYQLLSRLLVSPQPITPTYDERELQNVLLEVIEALREINQAKGSTLALVHLPLHQEFEDEDADRWRSWWKDAAQRENVPFVDMIGEMRELQLSQWNSMFGAHGHNSIEGNAYIASKLHERLVALDLLRE